jgi:peptide/nickel transport system permease protein
MLLGITLVTFLLICRIPGDPAQLRISGGRSAAPEAVAELRRQWQLDRPLVGRYGAWLWRSARLDFGRSLVDGRPVRERLRERLPVTLALALLAAGLAYGVAIPLGSFLATRRRLAAVEVLLSLAYGLPQAALGLFLLKWGAPYGARPGALLAAAASLSVAHAARLARIQRLALRDALSADYVLTARMKGAGERRALLHALKNALLPMATLLSADLPALLSGSVIAEQVFGLPGLGLLGLDAVLSRDYPMLLGLTTLSALVTLLAVVAADLAYARIDPRLRDEA